MRKEVELKIRPAELSDDALIKAKAARKCQLHPSKVDAVVHLRRSIDARGRTPFYRIRVAVFAGEQPQQEAAILAGYQAVDEAREVLIVGAGPAGYFAALELIELGLKPIVLDRGKDVRARLKDLKAIQRFGEVNPNSNYCFGEGGAGTYSDGKLYTRSHKRGNIEKSLRLLVEHGAKSDILVDAHPHIGSNKLPRIVANMRATIESYGGEVHFDTKVTDFIVQHGQLKGVVVNDAENRYADAVILATGHSARDIYYLLHQHQVTIEAKPFALGVRIEHPQALIDQAQYNQKQREPNMPASSYRLACQVKDRGVFSFCMCPGGLVVPAATAPGELVVNGMSLSQRNSVFANSGTVVAVNAEDTIAYTQQHGAFGGLEFQKSVEQKLFQFGTGDQRAPAQRLVDFVKGQVSKDLPKSSYMPGLYAAPLHQLLPDFISKRLQQGVQQFGRQMRGYYTQEAVVIGTESRTSSPVRIPRNRQTYMHEDLEALFPCGEGAGYAGGIISAAMDGQNVARAVECYLLG
ncbi:MAG: FAD-dependent oxidoreductase [Bacteroidota bacterium]